MEKKTIYGIEKDENRLTLQAEYEDGSAIGTIKNMRNVNADMWKDFKIISRIYGNNEGAAFTAVVMAWLRDPINNKRIQDAKQKAELSRKEKITETISLAENQSE